MGKKLFIRTFGCQMNDHDSERMAGLLKKDGYTLTNSPDEADIILINSCSIRDKAEHKAYSELGRYAKLKKERGDLIIGMTGCVAQQEGAKVFKRYPWVDLTLGSMNIPNLGKMVKARQSGEIHISAMDVPQEPPASTPAVRADRVRAWVNIMEGCDKHCSFCVVPTTRGPERSRPAGEILNEVRDLAEKGYQEVTLLGQTVNSYGKGSAVDFPDLLRMLNEVPGIQRIRFMTSHPIDLTPRLMEAMAILPKVCNHLHLPLQSGSDSVLQRMSRGYTRQEYIDKTTRLRNMVPNISLTTDIIVGFPGESDLDFDRTLEMIETLRFDSIFAFKFSPRSITPAARFTDFVPEEAKDERLQDLLALQRKVSGENNDKLLGSIQPVLVEAKLARQTDHLMGRTETNRSVRFPGTPSIIGKMVSLRIIRATVAGLEGEVVH